MLCCLSLTLSLSFFVFVFFVFVFFLFFCFSLLFFFFFFSSFFLGGGGGEAFHLLNTLLFFLRETRPPYFIHGCSIPHVTTLSTKYARNAPHSATHSHTRRFLAAANKRTRYATTLLIEHSLGTCHRPVCGLFTTCTAGIPNPLPWLQPAVHVLLFPS